MSLASLSDVSAGAVIILSRGVMMSATFVSMGMRETR